ELALPLARPHGPACGERAEELRGDCGHLVDGRGEGRGVRRRGLLNAAHLAHELEGGSADFLFGRGWLEVVKDADVAAHAALRRWPRQTSNPFPGTAGVASRTRSGHTSSARRPRRPARGGVSWRTGMIAKR